MRNLAIDLTTSRFEKKVELFIEKKERVALKIFDEIMQVRQSLTSTELCKNSHCVHCTKHHLPKIIESVKNNEPVVFVLPAFPGKSPNKEKVLGVLPDYAEELSLKFLGTISLKVKKYYEPGIKIIICSDGRVFSDSVGMKEENVTAYQDELRRLINKHSLNDISTFNLEDYFREKDFTKMRRLLLEKYGKPLEALKEKIRRGNSPDALNEEKEANSMYKGITRFLFEDAIFEGQEKSRALVQKEARVKAYEVIRKSNAWSDLIKDVFPFAVRLSIHPQVCGSKKLGIKLLGDEKWMTPWHGVAVQTKDGFILLKKKKAEELGAKLMYSSKGEPSYYKLEEN